MCRVFEIIDQNIEARTRRALELTTDSSTNHSADSCSSIGAINEPLRLEGVSFTYTSRPDTPVLQNVSVTIQPHTFTCFVGKSGAGKSSLVGVLSGLLFPQKGRISIGDHVLLDGSNRAQGAQWLHTNVGVVQQHDKSLMSGTVRENIEYGKVEKTTLFIL